MRALRVIGLHEDGKSIVCEDPARRERFLLPADERLRAAARGDITRLGQIEIELESQMRPREIQARIRAGDSVEQVAASAGVPVERVERFAHPVLLERSRNADLAQRAHPIREDGPDVRTLGEVVSYAFGVRAQDYAQAGWDSWRGEDGKWIIELSWQAGRSDNRARWSFAPGAHGGTVTAIDEHAEDMLDPTGTPRALRAVAHKEDGAAPAAKAQEPQQPMLDYGDGYADAPAREPGATVIEAPIPEPEEDDTTEMPRIPADESAEGSAQEAQTRPAKGKKNHPIVPAWEDVLLGVKSQRG